MVLLAMLLVVTIMTQSSLSRFVDQTMDTSYAMLRMREKHPYSENLKSVLRRRINHPIRLADLLAEYQERNVSQTETTMIP